MIPSSFDPSSLILLILGKENSWIPFIFLLTLVFQKWESIYDIYNKSFLLGKAQYKLTAKFYTNIDENNTYGCIGKSNWSLIRFINNLVKSNKNLLSNAYSLKLPYNDIFLREDIIVIPSNKTSIQLNNDITCRVDIQHDQRDTSKSDKTCAIDITTITFTLSTNKGFNTIMAFMNENVKNLNEFLNEKNKSNRYIIKPTFKKCDIPDSTDLSWPDTIDFESSKTFDNLFFEKKEELIRRLETFKSRTKYKQLGLPETLGLLFYGEPGTGKTSCIKAIANYMDMSLIIVPMNQIQTKKRLEELFFSDKFTIPQNKRIYVFEEIDCNGWQNIICDRHLIKQDEPEKSQLIIEQLSNVIKIDEKKIEKDTNDKLTLGAILEAIDGIVECPGRIIIMTTNHKDYLDSALLRPGRIDFEIEFKKLRGIDIKSIFEKWYGHSIDSDINIPDYKYSQAEISQLLFKYENDPFAFIKKIRI